MYNTNQMTDIVFINIVYSCIGIRQMTSPHPPTEFKVLFHRFTEAFALLLFMA